MDAQNREFGEARLLEAIEDNRGRDSASVLGCIVKAVQQFSEGEQSDDLTLIVARSR
jgi:serine phosphatase RsbU (regulator of sigma subunit)